MLKHRHSLTPLLLLTFVAALACDRVPLSLGTGIDDLVNDDDDSSSGGGTAAGAGGAASSGTGGYAGGGTSTGTGGAASGDCNDTYILCLDSGELPEICRGDLERCQYAGYPGSAGTGAGGTTGSAGTGAGGSASSGTGAAGTGAAGTGAGGATSDDCNDTYLLCLDSGELAELCRDDLERCQYAGYPSTAGSGSGGGASAGAGGTGSD